MAAATGYDRGRKIVCTRGAKEKTTAGTNKGRGRHRHARQMTALWGKATAEKSNPDCFHRYKKRTKPAGAF